MQNTWARPGFLGKKINVEKAESEKCAEYCTKNYFPIYLCLDTNKKLKFLIMELKEVFEDNSMIYEVDVRPTDES